jgi:hypothetical protein
MSARLLVASLGMTLLASAAACASSGAYGAPGYAAAAVGVAAAGAAASRLAGGCFAECINGTHCNRATGLCVTREPAHPASSGTASDEGHAPPLVVMSSSYPPGHEYEIPSVSADDAGCVPSSTETGDAGAISCEMEGGTL